MKRKAGAFGGPALKRAHTAGAADDEGSDEMLLTRNKRLATEMHKFKRSIRELEGRRRHVAFSPHSATSHHRDANNIERRRGMSDLDSWPVDEHVRVASPSVPCVCSRGVRYIACLSL